MSWTNEELFHAVARDEQLCRSNGMTDKVTFSWDHGRRFHAWRIDDYRPTGATGQAQRPASICRSRKDLVRTSECCTL